MRTQEPTNNSKIERKIISNFRNGQAVFIQHTFMGKKDYIILLPPRELPYFRFSTAKKAFQVICISLAGDEMRAMRSQLYIDEYTKALKLEKQQLEQSRIVSPEGQRLVK